MTKRSFVFIFLFVSTLLFALLVGGTVPYFIFYAVLLAFLIPLIHSLIILANLKAVIQIPEGSFYVGEKLLIEYEVFNNSIFYLPYVKIKSNMVKELSRTSPKEVLINLDPKSSFNHREEVIMKRRGYYTFGEIEVSIKDVFGLFPLKKNISSKTSILVYPEPIDLSTFQIPRVGQLGNLLINDPIFQDKSRVSSLRDYREGDSIKSIHWKLWPKLGDLIVKDYENRGDTSVVVFIDNYKESYKNDVDRRLEDKIVDISLSIISYYLNQHIFVSLETQDHEKQIEIQGEGSSHIKPFLETLARFKPNGAITFKDFLLPKIEFLKKDSTVVIVTPNLDKSMGTLGILLKTKSLDPLFIIVNDRENKTGLLNLEIESKLRKENIPIYILNHSSNIKETLEG
ncbi:MAG TPA: DUF58 domain-containing protein [Tissierellaceae bacterium]|nr:DUF58 domain-containing protein [Tissierellaceae bacterium]